MTVKIRQRTYLEGVEALNLADVDLAIGTHGTAGTGVTQQKLTSLLVTEELTAAADVTITDADASGGYGALKLVDLASSHLLVIGALLDVTLTGDGVNIAADAAVDIAIGTAAEAADATLDGTSADIIAKVDADFTTSTSSPTGVGVPSGTPVVIDASGGSSAIYLNLGVPDADISDDGVISVAGTVRLVYLDISKGA